MKTTINLFDFQRAFEELRPDNFTNEALEALFEYFDEIENSTGEEMEFDVIAICCEYSEDSFETIAELYNIEINSLESLEEQKQQVIDFLQSEGVFVDSTEYGIVYRQF